MSDDTNLDSSQEEQHNEIDLDSVKNYLTVNKDKDNVKDFMKSFQSQLSKDAVDQWLSNDEEGKNYFSKVTDKRVTQAIKSYKENHFAEALKAEVEREIRERYPDETEDQKRIRDLEKKFQSKEREAKMERLNNYALRISQDKKLGNLRSIAHLVKDTDSEDDVLEKIKIFEEDMNYIAKQAVNKVLVKGNRNDMSGDDEVSFSADDLKNASPEFYAKNREAILKSLANKKR